MSKTVPSSITVQMVLDRIREEFQYLPKVAWPTARIRVGTAVAIALSQELEAAELASGQTGLATADTVIVPTWLKMLVEGYVISGGRFFDSVE